MQPTKAAQAMGVTYATAKRYYELWADEIKRSLEAKLLPSLEASVKGVTKNRRKRKAY